MTVVGLGGMLDLSTISVPLLLSLNLIVLVKQVWVDANL